MKDDITFYIEFIKEIEKNTCLYDHHDPEYTNKKYTEAIWNKIAESFEECIVDIKNKWRIIRSSYTRSINTKAKSVGPKKDYYLAPYLRFLHPFTKTRAQDFINKVLVPNTDDSMENSDSSMQRTKQDLNTNDSSSDEDLRLQVDETAWEKQIRNRSELRNSVASTSNNNNETNSRKRKAVYENLTSKKIKNEEDKDPCELYLLSLFPYMTSMTQRQQIQFQKGIAELIEKIKYPDAS